MSLYAQANSYHAYMHVHRKRKVDETVKRKGPKILKQEEKD